MAEGQSMTVSAVVREALAALDLGGQSWIDEEETRPWCGRFQVEGAMRVGYGNSSVARINLFCRQFE